MKTARPGLCGGRRATGVPTVRGISVHLGEKMKKLSFSALLSSLVMLSANGVAIATPSQWPANGHFYEAITPVSGMDWSQANSAASSSVFQGLQGHLATITSAEENSFIYGLLDSQSPTWGYFLGGYQLVSSNEPDGGWTWVTNETFSYTKWNAGEPNNGGGDQNVLWMYGDAAYRVYSGYLGGEWDDMWGYYQMYDGFNSGPNIGYIVEYEAFAVPEPNTVILFLFGGVVLAANTAKRGSFS